MTSPHLTELDVTLYRMIYQVYTRLKNCMEQALREQGPTMEQYLVLVSIRYHGQPARISDIAHWLERSTNSLSMIVDRMVRAGLLRRVRGKTDRRIVNVFLTSKAERILDPANVAVWDFMEQGISRLSVEDKHTFASLFELVNYKLLEYLNPGADVEAMIKDDRREHAFMAKRWRKQD